MTLSQVSEISEVPAGCNGNRTVSYHYKNSFELGQ